MIFHDVQQNSPEWEGLRVGKSTGSNAGCYMANFGKAFGEPAKRYALQIALERISGKKAEHSFSNEHMERGHEQEPIAKMLYEDEYFAEIANGGFFDCGEHGDSPDGLVGTDGVIEVKSVIASTHYDTIKRKSYDPSYKWQLASHLDCSGRDWVDFISYCSDFPLGKQLYVYRVTRDEMKDELKMLQERRAEFLELVKATQQNIEAI